jgi:hypothetical protein
LGIAFSPFPSGWWSGIIIIKELLAPEDWIAKQNPDNIIRISSPDAFDSGDFGPPSGKEGDFASDLQPHQRGTQR